MIAFFIDYSTQSLSGRVVYVPEDYAFQTIPSPPYWNSILLNTLELTLDITRRITGVGGYCPHTGWANKRLDIPLPRTGGVICDEFPSFQKRLPMSVDNRAWNVAVDREKGWVCIGDAHVQYECVEVFSGFLMAVDNRVLRSVWICKNPYV